MERKMRERSSSLPLIDFQSNGNLLIEGRSIPEDAAAIYNPYIEFIDKLVVDKVTLNINFEYFNTSTSKKLMELLKHLDANNKIASVLVIWHFEEGDEDSLEIAEIYEESLFRVNFRYLEYAEVA